MIRHWYYNIVNFLKNIKMFTRFAWRWRSWDSEYTIEVLIALLKSHGDSIKKAGIHTDSEKTFRRCYTAAGHLNRAYINVYQDKVVSYLHDKNPIKFNHGKVERNIITPEPIFIAVGKIASKRQSTIRDNNKREAYEYLYKHLGEIWW